MAPTNVNICEQCRGTSFSKRGAKLVCNSCFSVLESYQKEVSEFDAVLSSRFRTPSKKRKIILIDENEIDVESHIKNKEILLFQAYQHILLVQANALIEKLHIPKEIIEVLEKLWFRFLVIRENENENPSNNSHPIFKKLPSMEYTLAFCFVACLWLRIPILETDFLRWVKDDRLPFLTIRKKLPPKLFEAMTKIEDKIYESQFQIKRIKRQKLIEDRKEQRKKMDFEQDDLENDDQLQQDQKKNEIRKENDPKLQDQKEDEDQKQKQQKEDDKKEEEKEVEDKEDNKEDDKEDDDEDDEDEEEVEEEDDEEENKDKDKEEEDKEDGISDMNDKQKTTKTRRKRRKRKKIMMPRLKPLSRKKTERVPFLEFIPKYVPKPDSLIEKCVHLSEVLQFQLPLVNLQGVVLEKVERFQFPDEMKKVVIPLFSMFTPPLQLSNVHRKGIPIRSLAMAAIVIVIKLHYKIGEEIEKTEHLLPPFQELLDSIMKVVNDIKIPWTKEEIKLISPSNIPFYTNFCKELFSIKKVPTTKLPELQRVKESTSQTSSKSKASLQQYEDDKITTTPPEREYVLFGEKPNFETLPPSYSELLTLLARYVDTTPGSLQKAIHYWESNVMKRLTN